MLAWEKANGVNRKSSKYWEQLERAERLHGPSPYQPRMGDKAPEIFWPTPQAHDAASAKSPEQIAEMRDRTGAGVSNLNEAASMWATPRANERGQTSSADAHEALSKQVGTWPTPRVWDANVRALHTGSGGESLSQNAMLWNTPRVGTHGQPGARSTATGDALEPQAQRWATTIARDWRSDSTDVAFQGSPPLGRQVLRIETAGSDTSSSAPGTRPVLNPRFVEALQGFATGWTEIL